MRPQFTRAIIAIICLNEVVSVDKIRFDHDPVILAPKEMLLEPSRTNIFINSDSLGAVVVGGVTIAPLIDFPLFSSGGGGLIIIGDDVPRTISIVQNTTLASPNDRTYSICLRRGSNNFAQLVGQYDEH